MPHTHDPTAIDSAVSEADVRALAARLSPAPHIVTLDGTSVEGIYAE